jgi:hypothetical protein
MKQMHLKFHVDCHIKLSKHRQQRGSFDKEPIELFHNLQELGFSSLLSDKQMLMGMGIS